MLTYICDRWYGHRMENRKAIGLKLPPGLVKRLDMVRGTLPAKPPRTSCIEEAVEDWIIKHDRKASKRKEG
jgi:hypothetical protein